MCGLASSSTRLTHHTGAETAQSPHDPPAEAASLPFQVPKEQTVSQDRQHHLSRQVWVPLSLCTQSALSGLLGMSIQDTCPCLLLTWCISHLRYVALEHQELVKDVVTGLSALRASCWLFSLHSSRRPFFPGQLS